MINLLGRQLSSCSAALLALIAVVLLQGCGAERTEPFNPDLSSSSCSSSSSSSSSSTFFTDSSSSLSSSSSSSSCSSSSSSSSSNSSSSSSVTPIEIRDLWSGVQTPTVIEKKEKDFQIIRNESAFNTAAIAYIGHTLATEDFNEGQVVLVDDGEIDSCAAYLEFNKTITAEQLTDNTVKVTLNYLERPKQENCSPSYSRPFIFYYLKTTKLIVKEEKIVK